MVDNNHSRPCIICGSPVAHHRWALGYKTCMPCGESAALGVKRCVVPMHKSNYVMVTDLSDLKGINNKGGLVK
jgi:ribosomal protein L37AE/L43A